MESNVCKSELALQMKIKAFIFQPKACKMKQISGLLVIMIVHTHIITHVQLKVVTLIVQKVVQIWLLMRNLKVVGIIPKGMFVIPIFVEDI